MKQLWESLGNAENSLSKSAFKTAVWIVTKAALAQDKAKNDCSERWPSYAEALAEERARLPCASDHGSGPSEAHLDKLVDSRLACIRPVLRAEVALGLGLSTEKPTHEAVLRRNVGAHARGIAASWDIAALDSKGLRSAQKVLKSADTQRLAERLHLVELRLACLEARTSEDLGRSSLNAAEETHGAHHFNGSDSGDVASSEAQSGDDDATLLASRIPVYRTSRRVKG